MQTNRLREALVKAQTALVICEWPDGTRMEGVAELLRQIDAALAAPPRNCDRPECATLEMATKTWIQEEFGPYCNNSKVTMADIRTFDVWIYAPATKQEGDVA